MHQSGFLRLYLMSVPNPIRDPTYLSSSHLLGSLWAVTGAQASLAFDDLHSFEMYWWSILQNVPHSGFVGRGSHDVSYREEDHRGEVPPSSHHNQGCTTLTYHCGCWPWSPGWGSLTSPSWFSTVTPLPPAFHIVLLRRSHCVQPTLKQWGLKLLLLEGRVST